MFNPIASGINPKIVVIAVSTTGRKRALPALTMLSNKSGVLKYSFSSKPNAIFFLSISN